MKLNASQYRIEDLGPKIIQFSEKIKQWLRQNNDYKKLEIGSKFRINDSSKIFADNLSANTDFSVSIKSSTIA